MYPISLHNQFIIGKTNAMFCQIQNPPKKEKKQQNLLLEKKKKSDFEKDPSDDSHQNNFFFTPRMIVAGIQNIVMVVGFVSY
jgi:hypothetical protein